ncbi:hypothetical protein INR49_012604 [Caranx melampygus]|nr:hypothetical protein INR49_012604 [Caranx melampygus]
MSGLFIFLHWEINCYLISRRSILSLLDVEWQGAPGVGGGETRGIRSLKVELVWVASHLSMVQGGMFAGGEPEDVLLWLLLIAPIRDDFTSKDQHQRSLVGNQFQCSR